MFCIQVYLKHYLIFFLKKKDVCIQYHGHFYFFRIRSDTIWEDMIFFMIKKISEANDQKMARTN